MQQIHIRFCSVDEQAGVIFLQFATDESLPLIEQSTMHGFFPAQHQTFDMEALLPLMAEFGRQVVMQQEAINQNSFTADQANQFKQLVGSTKAVPISDFTTGQSADLYNVAPIQSSNVQIDQMRNIVLEILAEEGLIPGALK
jgi:hypothetical protein